MYKGLYLSKKTWLSAVLLLTMVLTLVEVFILGLHYDPPSTARIQQLAYNTNHKLAATKLLGNYLTTTY